jgi:hypothetical protein
MSPQAWRSAFIAMLAILILAASLAVACGARAATPGGWATCSDRRALFTGPYRYYDDIFNGRSGHFCIRAERHGILIQDIVHGQPGGVVAYPAVQYGPWYAWRDASSGLPLQLGWKGDGLGTMTADVSSTGHGSGTWQSDLDIWLYPTSATTGHPNREIVIVNRSSHATVTGPPYRYVRIAGTGYELARWETCPADVGLCWPLTLLVRLHQAGRAAVPVSAVLRYGLAHGWMASWEWLGSVDYGTEIWSGVLRLTDRMVLRWTPVPCICER